MMKTFVTTALIAALANAFEEHSTDFEDLVIDTVANFAPEGEKFISYEKHLGRPAMHAELEDGKLLFLSFFDLRRFIRTHQA